MHCLVLASNFPSFLAQPPYDRASSYTVPWWEIFWKISFQGTKVTVTEGTDVEEEKNERKKTKHLYSFDSAVMKGYNQNKKLLSVNLCMTHRDTNL